ncbi:MAG: alpha-galactosidase [Lachnospiraceae bacterium]|jgi:alpha-galactosidase|nr:alpha-galactosidase [Lachnospiraceae bacterium]
MAIEYHAAERIFKLDTKATSYLIGVVDGEGFLGHIYYGKRLRSHRVAYLLRTGEAPFVPSQNNRDRGSFMDCFPWEYPTHGRGDFRESCLAVRTAGGHSAVSLSYRSHEIIAGKPELPGLPATRGQAADCDTLIITAVDEAIGLEVELLYTVYKELDVIARSVRVTNTAAAPVYLTKIYSACLDMNNNGFEVLTLHGSWARERHIETTPLGHAAVSIGSLRGESGHQNHPFIALKNKNTTEESGEVYALHFVYSGNFHAQAQADQFDMVRLTMGIHPEDFCWQLDSGASFQAPEVVLTYSDRGLGGMTRTLHDLYRQHLISGPYKDKKRPILINNWEATYFDFNTDKLIAIAKDAAELGLEMLVMDDGWFGNRHDDNRALGDWVVNEEKLAGGLTHLVNEVNKLGLKFGIWFEPEMVSPDSDLYRAHPDWAIALPDRAPTLSRNQCVLDLSRQEVIDYVYESVARVLRSANIEYVKWDMNRPLCDLGSAALPPERMGELCHRYTLGVYQLQGRLLAEFPHLLLENCSGGGARFDPGMLYYSPQIWCSDDTDAIERLAIQEGTALIYPLSTIGAHVSDCPNHTVGRATPFATRGLVALAGTFGYELDVTKIPAADRAMIPEQVALYHRYNDLIRTGDYYRLASYAENRYYDCYGVVSKDKTEALFTYIQVLARPCAHSRRVQLKGLSPEYDYRIEETGEVFGGDILMEAGLLFAPLPRDFQGKLVYLEKV